MNRKLTRRQVLTAAAAGAALTLCGCRQQEPEEAKPELILRYAENQPEDYPTTQAALAFAGLMADQTDGRVKVAVYSGGELGAEQSVSQMWRVLDGSIGDDFLAMLDQMDLVGLSWFDAGVRSFYTREKVTDLEQLQGLTLRVQESDMMSEMITDLGAEPVQVVYSQVYAALRNGQIDGAENNWPSYDAMGHYEVAPYFLQDEHTRVPEVQLASTAAIEKLEALDPSYPEVLRTCARESARTERRLWAQREARSEKELREWGVEVTTLPDAEKQKFRAAVQPLYDRFADQAELLERIKES